MFKRFIGWICKVILNRPDYEYEREHLNRWMAQYQDIINEYEAKLKTLNPQLKRDTQEIRDTLGYINQYKMKQHHVQKQLEKIYLRSKR